MKKKAWVVAASLPAPLLLLTLCLSSLANASPTYFVVSEIQPFNDHGDSYLLPLTNPADIAHARNLIIDQSTGMSIVVAHITAGSDGINRDVLAPGEPLWSWHVDQFVQFADFTAEILDGWPSFVEEDVDGWIHNTQSHVGFWTYTITAELSVPEPGSIVSVLLGLVGILAFVAKRRARGTGQ